MSEPQNRTFATRIASPSLAPQAEKVMNTKSREGLRETVVQKNINRAIKAVSVAASKINRSVKIEGWACRKNRIIIIKNKIIDEKKV